MANEPVSLEAIDTLIANHKRAVARARGERTRAVIFAIDTTNRGGTVPPETDQLQRRLDEIIATGERRVASLEIERQRALLARLGARGMSHQEESAQAPPSDLVQQ